MEGQTEGLTEGRTEGRTQGRTQGQREGRTHLSGCESASMNYKPIHIVCSTRQEQGGEQYQKLQYE